MGLAIFGLRCTIARNISLKEEAKRDLGIIKDAPTGNWCIMARGISLKEAIEKVCHLKDICWDGIAFCG